MVCDTSLVTAKSHQVFMLCVAKENLYYQGTLLQRVEILNNVGWGDIDESSSVCWNSNMMESMKTFFFQPWEMKLVSLGEQFNILLEFIERILK